MTMDEERKYSKGVNGYNEHLPEIELSKDVHLPSGLEEWLLDKKVKDIRNYKDN